MKNSSVASLEVELSLNTLVNEFERSKALLTFYRNNKKQTIEFNKLFPVILNTVERLSKLGLAKGDTVGILGKNSLEWIIIDLSTIFLGLVTFPIDPNANQELEKLCEKYELKFIFQDTKIAGFEKIVPFHQVIDQGEIDDVLLNKEIKTREGIFNKNPFHENDNFTILTSSGTTGEMKSVLVNQKNFCHLLSTTNSLFEFSSRDNFLIFLPLHIYLERCYIYAAILLDFKITLVPFEMLFYSIKNDKPTVIIGIPLFFENFQKLFLQHIKSNFLLHSWYKAFELAAKLKLRWVFGNKFYPFTKAWGGHIRYLMTGSAPIGLGVLEFYERMGITLFEGYGMTELGGMISLNYPGSYKLGSVGKPVKGKLVKIDDQHQIQVKCENKYVKSYYRSSPEEAERTYLPDGFIATGDVGFLDKDGFLYINGRIKDIIILSNGIKVHPAILESKFSHFNEILHVMVYGDAKPYLSAIIVKSALAASDKQISEIVGAVNAALPKDERIYKYFIVSEKFTPENGLINANLKINRKAVKIKYDKDFKDLYL